MSEEQNNECSECQNPDGKGLCASCLAGLEAGRREQGSYREVAIREVQDGLDSDDTRFYEAAGQVDAEAREMLKERLFDGQPTQKSPHSGEEVKL